MKIAIFLASEPLLEESPKWNALSEVLDEIDKENEHLTETLGPGKVLIAAADDRICQQIHEVGESVVFYLTDSACLTLLLNMHHGYSKSCILITSS